MNRFSFWQSIRLFVLIFGILFITSKLQSQVRYELEDMKIVAGPNVDPIPIIATDSTMYFWSWGTVGFKPDSSGTVKIKLFAREDHSESDFGIIAIKSENEIYVKIDSESFKEFFNDTLLIIKDSVYISFINDNWDRNVEVDWIELIEIVNLDTTNQENRVCVEWSANLEPDLAGYRLYQRFAEEDYIETFYDVGLDTFYIVNWLPWNIEIFFVVTAYDTANNESEFSNEVSIILSTDFKKGDWNQDRKIDIFDLKKLKTCYGATCQEILYLLIFDFNENCYISIYDLKAFRKVFGLTY